MKLHSEKCDSTFSSKGKNVCITTLYKAVSYEKFCYIRLVKAFSNSKQNFPESTVLNLQKKSLYALKNEAYKRQKFYKLVL